MIKAKELKPSDLARSNTEESNQVAFFCFIRKAQKIGIEQALIWSSYTPHTPFFTGSMEWILNYNLGLNLIYHTPNGKSRGDTKKTQMIRGAQLKAMGVKPGVYDVFMPLPNGVYCGFYLEFKRPAEKGSSKLSDDQVSFGEQVRKVGYCATSCYSWQEGIDKLISYLKGQKLDD